MPFDDDEYQPRRRSEYDPTLPDDPPSSDDLSNDNSSNDDPTTDAPPSAEAPETVPGVAASPAVVQGTSVRCSGCGYDLTGVSIGSRCPECDAPVDTSLYASGQPTSGLAIASMVLGIISLIASFMVCMCVGPILGLPTGIAGLICWKLADTKIKAGAYSSSSKGINMAGLILNAAGILISLAWVVLFGVLIILDQ